MPDALRILCGHIVHQLTLFRPMLACLQAVYRFINLPAQQVYPIPADVSAELTLVARVLPIIAIDLARDTFPICTMSDGFSK